MGRQAKVVRMDPEILIVSGLPRSGTSLMMQMLVSAGLEAITDNVRTADTDNPRGYYEFEQVKKIKQDASWLPQARGKVVKMVSQLLYDLPPGERYRTLFMERDLDEVLASQEKMLARLGRTAAPREKIREAITLHLERLHNWLGRQPNMAVLCVSYNALLQRPREQAQRVRDFLGRSVDLDRMVHQVDWALYRNRKSVTALS
jgi:hypothetical protein